MAIIELEGFEDFEDLLKNMILDENDKKRAVRTGIKVIAEGLEKSSPVGKTGNLSEIKITVRDKDLATEGLARSTAFYDVFQEYGTSKQKANVGYFERALDGTTNEAVQQASKFIFDKMR